MSEHQIQIVKRFYSDVIAQGRLEATADLLADGYVDHQVSPDRRGAGPLIAWLAALDREYRNRVVTLEDSIDVGDFVAIRWSGSFSRSGYREPGTTIETSGTGVFRIEGGRIAERWEHEDGAGMVRVLALLQNHSSHQGKLGYLSGLAKPFDEAIVGATEALFAATGRGALGLR